MTFVQKYSFWLFEIQKETLFCKILKHLITDSEYTEEMLSILVCFLLGVFFFITRVRC